MWSIIVHGGAGAILDALENDHVEGCRAAVRAGAEVLAAGGSALDAVQFAVRVLEDAPVFNAGTGGALDERGLMAADAAMMRGSDLAYGAIGSVVGLKNPIDLARAVLDESRHCFLVGPPALDFAREKGVRIVDPASVITDRMRGECAKRLREMAEAAPLVGLPAAANSQFHAEFDDGEEVDLSGDTVGAVAIDVRGGCAAATSTGGLSAKRAGRVGDSPVAGAGTYASEIGALSATGHGETMLRTVFAYRALQALGTAGMRRTAGMAGTAGPADMAGLGGMAGELGSALRRELDWATAKAGGKGGAIAVISAGVSGGVPIYARNTRHMGVAWQSAGHPIRSDF